LEIVFVLVAVEKTKLDDCTARERPLLFLLVKHGSESAVQFVRAPDEVFEHRETAAQYLKTHEKGTTGAARVNNTFCVRTMSALLKEQMAMKADKRPVIWQPTPRQSEFLSCPAREVLYGGAAGGARCNFARKRNQRLATRKKE
jgi:hypothetical protein